MKDEAVDFLHPSSFILHPSSFIFHPSSFILHPSSFILHPSSFILHPSSFRPNPLLTRIKKAAPEGCRLTLVQRGCLFLTQQLANE